MDTSTLNRDPKDVEDNKDLAAFSYLWIMSILVYFARKNSPFIRFHARQAILLFILSVICWFIPFIGRILELIVLFGMVYGFLNAAQGQWKDVPFVGPLSRGEMTVRQTWKELLETLVSISHSIRAAFKNETETKKPDSDKTPPVNP